ncbi:putative structural protein [Klebsiella phage K64-1]|uniref:Probable tail spike protein n=1 Tax=Klebsiella phage K64-1 TaxID=1439894 RepID=DPO23_BPK64|nr:tail protein [Klebsiella phage K64-1]A0A0A8JA06.1 RecName: Full=Probable tail spike protein; AltName: Full=Depolymerase, capsule K35-specific; Contains: RecName: Full=Mature tail spike protein; Contains: RecName: Full=Intramolecular chaperone [Klebsiella phage K64-1]BAQ02840.1 putative structural protein [Klebsiella phage K64-1]BAW85697.1 lyase [Klebsiella phage K64-1]
MINGLIQPKGSVSKETNKNSIALSLGLKFSEVEYLSTEILIDTYIVVFDPISEMVFYVGNAKGNPQTWNLNSDGNLILTTDFSTYTLLKIGLSNPDTSLKIGYQRKKINDSLSSIESVAGYMNSNFVSIMEFQHLITSKPNLNDMETWDWSPALDAAISYVQSYIPQTAVNSQMYGVMPIVFPPGVFQYSTEMKFTKYLNSTGSLSTCYTLIGSGMTSTVLQPITQGQNAFTATQCKINLINIGFRSGASYQTGAVLGSSTAWLPVVHSNWRCVGFSGFARGVVANLLFDSTFEDIFIQNISNMQSTSDVSYGFTFEVYTGPANGGTTGDGSGDDSNQITFIRPTIETSNADNAILFNASSINSTYPHHAINVFGGHIETHNLKAKCYNLKNCFNVNFYGTIFSQNGSAVDTNYRLGYIEACYNINFKNCRQVTTNRLTAYSSTDVKSIKITGNSKNIIFDNNHFINPYYSLNTYNKGPSYNIDSDTATVLDDSYLVINCTFNTYTNRNITSKISISNKNICNKNHILTVNDNGELVVSYTTSTDYSVTPTDILSFTNTGQIKTNGSIQLGIYNGTAGSKSIDFYSNGDKTTSMARILVDSSGRLYIRSFNGSQEWVFGSNAITPTTTSVYSIGSPSLTVNNLYVQNPVTVVSDENYKSNIQKIPDELLDAWENVEFNMWKMKAAINVKGITDARWHVGYIAQKIKSVLENAGLNWQDYGLITYESWIESEETYDQNGNVLSPYKAEGEIYMLRMEECLAVEMAYQRRKLDRIEKQLQK